MTYTYDYPMPSVSADCVIFTLKDNQWFVLLIQRKHPPFRDCWAFPGGFMEIDETVEETAKRELEEETGLTGIILDQLHVFSRVGRDPRQRIVDVAFYSVVYSDVVLKAGDDAGDVRWFPISQLPQLAFDHNEILDMAIKEVIAS